MLAGGLTIKEWSVTNGVRIPIVTHKLDLNIILVTGSLLISVNPYINRMAIAFFAV